MKKASVLNFHLVESINLATRSVPNKCFKLKAAKQLQDAKINIFCSIITRQISSELHNSKTWNLSFFSAKSSVPSRSQSCSESCKLSKWLKDTACKIIKYWSNRQNLGDSDTETKHENIRGRLNISLTNRSGDAKFKQFSSPIVSSVID